MTIDIAPTPIARPLDDYLREVVQTLHTAVSQESPDAALPQIHDCEEIIGEIMTGHVSEWLP
jgi:hypothetical protein